MADGFEIMNDFTFPRIYYPRGTRKTHDNMWYEKSASKLGGAWYWHETKLDKHEENKGTSKSSVINNKSMLQNNFINRTSNTRNSFYNENKINQTLINALYLGY